MALTKIDDRGLKTPIDLLDNEKIRLGTGNDLEISHNGSSSVIQHTNTTSGNNLLIESDTKVIFRKITGSEKLAQFNVDGSVELYHNNSKKIETSSSGATISGALTTNVGSDNSDVAILTGGDTSRGLKITTSATSNTNDAVVTLDAQTATHGTLAFAVANGSEKMRIDSSGKVKIGTSATPTQSGALNVFGTDQATSQVSIRRGSGDAAGPRLHFQKSRNTTDGSHTVVQTNDVLGQIVFAGNDGAGPENGGLISCEVDGTPGGNDLPSRLVFSTTPDGSDTLSERMRINSSGRLLIGSTVESSHAGIDSALQIIGTGTDDSSITMSRFSNDHHSAYLVFSKSRNGSIGGNTVVQDGDSLGRITFFGNDGTDGNTPATEIDVEVDGTPGSNDMPGRIVFRTTADGASSTTERLRIDSDGHMGLGVTPNANWPSDGDTRAFQIGSGAVVFGRGSGDEDRGGIGVNYYTDNVGNKYLANGHAARVYLNDGNIDFDNTAAVNTNGAGAGLTLTTRMRIEAGGNIGMGLTPQCTTGKILNLDDEFFIGFGNGGSGRPDFQIGTTNGNTLDFRCGYGADTADLEISTSGVFSGDFNDTSDERLKDNIQDISANQINIVKQLRPVTFDWKETEKGSNTGFIAQEVIKLLPNDVAHSDPTNTDSNLGINNMGLTAVLTKALQEAIAKIETLETKVAALEAA